MATKTLADFGFSPHALLNELIPCAMKKTLVCSNALEAARFELERQADDIARLRAALVEIAAGNPADPVDIAREALT